MALRETRVVEYACRHRDVVKRDLYSDWLGERAFCEICGAARKIVWTDGE